MSDPSYELQQALYDALKNNIGPEVGSRVYDTVPGNAVFPYVTIGEGQVLPDKADCVDGTEHFPLIHVWSRATGYPESKTISKNILAVLDDKALPMNGGYTAVIFELENIQYMRDPDGLTSHVALTFHTRIEAYDAPPLSTVTSAIGAAAGSGSAAAIGSGLVAATWNASDASGTMTLSGGNLIATAAANTDQAVRSTLSRNSGKRYVEFTAGATYSGGADIGVGIATSAAALSTVGSTKNGAFVVIAHNGNIWFNGTDTTKTLLLIGANSTIGMAIDFTTQRGWFRNGLGNWNGDPSANPATNVGGIDLSALFPSTAAFALFCSDKSAVSTTVNFGGSAFINAAPSGFVSWNT